MQGHSPVEPTLEAIVFESQRAWTNLDDSIAPCTPAEPASGTERCRRAQSDCDREQPHSRPRHRAGRSHTPLLQRARSCRRRGHGTAPPRRRAAGGRCRSGGRGRGPLRCPAGRSSCIRLTAVQHRRRNARPSRTGAERQAPRLVSGLPPERERICAAIAKDYGLSACMRRSAGSLQGRKAAGS